MYMAIFKHLEITKNTSNLSAPTYVHVPFAVDKVMLGQDLPQSTPPTPATASYSPTYQLGVLAVQRYRQTVSPHRNNNKTASQTNSYFILCYCCLVCVTFSEVWWRLTKIRNWKPTLHMGLHFISFSRYKKHLLSYTLYVSHLTHALVLLLKRTQPGL
jgi:hypothetical protein